MPRVRVKVAGVAETGVAGATAQVPKRSATALTIVVVNIALFERLGSVSMDVAEAALAAVTEFTAGSTRSMVGVSTRVTVVDPPGARLPRLQLTWLLPEQVPDGAVVVAETTL